MMKERTPGFWGICGFSPDSTLGTEITKSRPKSRRALPEMVLATSPTRSFMVSWLKSFSCIFISSTVSIALGAVKYTTPSRFPEMLMTPVYSCTGVINISGKREGVVYFTAPKAMLTVLLMKMQENDFSHETMKDLVGEVANTISGNARRDFGRDFVISVPSVLSGEKPQIPQKPGVRSFIIPINWRSHSAKLIVSLT